MTQEEFVQLALDKKTSILTGTEIHEAIRSREIVIDPILDPRSQIDPVSVDLRLDNYFGRFKTTEEPYIHPTSSKKAYLDFNELEFFRDKFVLQQSDFVLAQTFEYIALPDHIVGFLEGRSSVGRRGVMVHVTAGVVDPGFSGHLVFELANVGKMPTILFPLMRIARMTFFRTNRTQAYSGQYRFQVKIRPPRADSDLVAILKKFPKEAVD